MTFAAEGTFEANVERPGGDYSTLILDPGSPARFCRDACERDARCRAWTYARPVSAGANPRCMLKSTVPEKKADPCCVSGVAR